MKNLLVTTIISFFLFLSLLGCSQKDDNNNEYLNIQYEVKNDGVFVSISDKNLTENLMMRFPMYLPGTYSPIKTPFRIKQSPTNNPKYFIDTIQRTIHFQSITKNKEIKYFVENSDFTTHNIMSDGIFISSDLAILNHNVLLGIIPEYENKKIKLKIVKNEKYHNISTSNFTSLDKYTDTYTFNSYKELYDSPIVYASQKDKFQIITNGITFNFGVYAPLKQITTQSLRLILEPTIKAVAQTIKFCYDKYNYNFTFLFNSKINKDILYSSALEHKHASIYCFFTEPNLKKEKDSLHFANDIKSLVSHECMHLFTPLSFADSLTSNFNFFNKEHSPNLFLYEGFTEYQSLKLLLNHKIISDSTFLSIMAKKIVRFDKYRKMKYYFNLNTLSRNIYQKPNWLRIYYSRGAVLAFLLDINIIKYTNGEQDLFSILREISKEHNTFTEDFIYTELIGKIPKLETFMNLYVMGDKYPILKNELLKCGLSYTKIIPKDNYYYPFKIVNEYNTNPKIYIYNKDYSIPKDTFALKSINNHTELNSFIFNTIYRSNSISKEDKCTITLENQGETKTYTIKSMKEKYPLVPFYPQISINKNQTASQKTVFNKLFRQQTD